MKKLIFSLMTLLMAAPALAEEAVQEASLMEKGLSSLPAAWAACSWC